VQVGLVTIVEDPSVDLGAFLSYHRVAGIDVILVGGDAGSVRNGGFGLDAGDEFLRHVETTSVSELARVAAHELGVDWVVPSAPDQYWWPRGESFKDVLAVIPPRYGVVQALVRTFLPRTTDDQASPPETWTIRTSLLGPDGSRGAALHDLLRPIYRAGSDMHVDPQDWTLGGRRVPLRAWYPIEVLAFPAEQARFDDAQLEALLADGSLVADTRLRDALRAGAEYGFSVPTIVDDASYAVECAAVGEVDLVALDRQIRELERRIGELEARFWPSVGRRLRRLARRPG
jgi:hypothetical protein